MGSKVSEVVLGPENRTVASNDNFLRVNLVGDFAGYTNIPSFEDFYLVIPRQSGQGQPENLGKNFSMWMLLERVRFTLDGVECNKIGVDYDAFNSQPNFCASPFWSCLHNQLWNFWEADRNRIKRHQQPLYGLEGRFERINQHPNSGSHSFSIGVTEVLNTNLLIELRADDIEFVYQRSPGKVLSVTIPTFEALTQFGVAKVTTQNIGELEASYSLTFDCSKGVSLLEEQYFIMKSKETVTRLFKLYPTTDQAAKYVCAAILKDSEFNEVDRAECQFSTTTMALDNGSQSSFDPPSTSGNGFFDSIEIIWNKLWDGLVDFITGDTCRKNCSSLLDFSCHIQYICMSWIVLFGLLLSIFPTVLVLLWLLHQKGVFDPIYDWWNDDYLESDNGRTAGRKHKMGIDNDHLDPDIHFRKHHHHKPGSRHRKHDARHKRSNAHNDHERNRFESEADYNYYLHHVHHVKHKHHNTSSMMQQTYLDGRHHRHKRERERESVKRTI